jgi:predicted metalloprotease with PDZ domain
MSEMAPFTDGGRPIDRTNWSNTVISYYPFGGAIALALDLSLRERFEGRVTLDDFMRAMWRVHGRPSDSRPGYVAHPYTMADAEQRLAEVSGDEGFAHGFFGRYIRGREVADYATLLAPAGFALQKRNPGQAWWGDMRLEGRNGLRIGTPPVPTAPAYKAGLDVDDEIRMFDGAKVAFPEDVTTALRRHKPGDRVDVEYVDRSGTPRIVRVTLDEDPRLDLVAIESTGRTLTAAQIAFRAAWLGRKG